MRNLQLWSLLSADKKKVIQSENEAHRAFEHAAAGVEAGKISRSWGTCQHPTISVEEYVCEKFGHPCSENFYTGASRDPMLSTLRFLPVPAWPHRVYGWSRSWLRVSDQREVEEFLPKVKKQFLRRHKRNLAGSETHSLALSVVIWHVPGENVALWHESKIFHSSAERIITPDTTILGFTYMPNCFGNIVKNFIWFSQKIYPRNTWILTAWFD